METADAPLLFDSDFLAKLEQLYLLSKKIFRGDRRADRKSRHAGSSLEFADYRNYAFGDDLRTIDWNIYGRLDRLFVKLFEQEQDLHIYFLIDASASMRCSPESRVESRGSKTANSDPSTFDPRPSTKLDAARRVCAALAYIGLANLDRVNIHWFTSGLEGDMGLTRGKSQFHKALDFLRRAPQLDGETRLMPTLRSFVHRTKRRGLVCILSDLFDPAGYEDPLALLRHSQFDVEVIHVLDPAELRPGATGDLRLIEAETSAQFEVTANEALLRRYHEEIDSFLENLESFCTRRGIGYAQATTDVPFEDLVLRVLREGRIVK